MDKLQRYIVLYSNYVSDIMIINIAKYINLWWMENAGSNADPIHIKRMIPLWGLTIFE